MKKSILFTALMLFVFTVSQAQGELRFGVKAGLNVASIGGDSYYGLGSLGSRVSFHVGGLVEIPFSDKISLQPEVLYSSQGSKFTFSGASDTDTKLNYINVPILGKYHILKGLSGELGPVAGFLISAKDDDGDDIKDSFKSIDFGVAIGATYRFDMGVFGGLRYNKGITDINDVSGYNGKNQNNVFQIFAGYTF
ncbi:MAG: porin family protein [Flavobacteriales bacterium]